VYANSFGGTLCAANFLGCFITINGAIQIVNEAYQMYASPSTLGTLDATGTGNVYYEDNYFLGFWQAMSGLDDGARAVFRHNILDNSALGSHGPDTSNVGARQWEITDNTFHYDNMNPGACEGYNINYFFFIRGGTGIIADNDIADVNSGSCYGDKPEIVITVMNLRRRAGPNACWGANISGIQYPSPRQFGFGYVAGGAGNDVIGQYRGDSEPAYIWNNRGASVIALQDYSGAECTNPDSTSSYVQLGRDYFTSPKPNFVKYPYPHPLTASNQAGTAAAPAPVTNVRILR
jgi:hypothetical protein